MRLPERDGERLDRSGHLTFTFNGRPVHAHPGDTIASALYASGQRVFTRSFKYHRPRGLACATGGCANCLVNVDGEASVRACMRPVQGGELVAAQLHAASVERDPLSVLTALAKPFTPVGFYYRMLTRPRRLWPHYERALRRLTGVGRPAADGQASPRYTAEHRTVEVLVVGAGRAGRAAAARLGDEGREVLVVDERPEFAELELPGAEVLAPARALGIYEGGLVPVQIGRHKLRVSAGRVVLATGAVEQPLLVPGNDLVGVMTPSAALRLLELWAVRPGERAVIAAPAEWAREVAGRLGTGGVTVAEVVELSGPPPALAAHGRRGILEAVRVRGRRVECDLLVASSGRQPAYSLAAQAGARIEYDRARGIFVPVELPAGVEVTGSAGGETPSVLGPGAVLHKPGKCFVCPCEDVTVADLRRAVKEGFDSVEVLKRYTTVTMGPCQGRLCHLASARLLSEEVGDGAPASTTARPPWSPAPLGLLASRRRVPGKRTAIHGLHQAGGAQMVWTGAWRRADHYGDPAGEVDAVHTTAGMLDYSTLGRLLVQGADALAFLNRVFPGRLATLEVGRVRYVVFNTETGRLIDDGTVIRLAEDTYLMTTSSGGSDAIFETFELWRERWGSRVHVVKLSSALGAISISGPAVRTLLGRLTTADLGSDAFPYMGAAQHHVAGVPCLLIRIGFLGELGYEMHFPSEYGRYLWETILGAGADLGLRPFGVEALKMLRLEKGHLIVGIDTDPESTMLEVGLERMIAFDKGEFVGAPALARMREATGVRRLVGFVADSLPPEGAAVVLEGEPVGRVTSARRSVAAGQVIGLAYVPESLSDDGTSFEFFAGPGRSGTARVHLAPFFDPDGARMRA